MTEWKPVTPDSPPRKTSVLACGIKRLGIAVAYRNEHDEWLVDTCSDVYTIYTPKWWMPLPEEPQQP